MDIDPHECITVASEHDHVRGYVGEDVGGYVGEDVGGYRCLLFNNQIPMERVGYES